MEDPPEELTAPADEVRSRITELLARLRAVVAEREDSARWFAMWGPVVKTLGRIAMTLGSIALRMKSSVAAGEFQNPLSEEDREVIVEELRALADDFPDVAEVFFGLHHVDRLVETVMYDESARSGASRIVKLLAAATERMVSKLVDVALGDKEAQFGPEEVLAFLRRFEGVTQEFLDRWVPRGLGMVSSVVYEEEE